jgi:hypothetical protein
MSIKRTTSTVMLIQLIYSVGLFTCEFHVATKKNY